MSTKLFQHSRMTRIAAVLFLLAGAVGLPTVMLLPDAGFRTVLRAQLAAGGVGERQAQNTWLALYGLVSVLCAAVPLIVAAGIGDSLRGHPARGLGRLSTLAQWAETAVNVAGAGLAVLFVYRFVRYAVLTLPENGGVYAFFAMAVMEGIMASLAAFLFFQLRKFLNALSDGTASMAYSFATGKLDDRAIPGRMASGFSWLAVGCLLLAGAAAGDADHRAGLCAVLLQDRTCGASGAVLRSGIADAVRRGECAVGGLFAVLQAAMRMGAALAAKGKNHRSGVSRSGKFYLHSSSPKTAESKIMAIGEGDFLRTAFQTPWTTHRMAKIRMPVQSGETMD